MTDETNTPTVIFQRTIKTWSVPEELRILCVREKSSTDRQSNELGGNITGVGQAGGPCSWQSACGTFLGWPPSALVGLLAQLAPQAVRSPPLQRRTARDLSFSLYLQRRRAPHAGGSSQGCLPASSSALSPHILPCCPGLWREPEPWDKPLSAKHPKDSELSQ